METKKIILATIISAALVAGVFFAMSQGLLKDETSSLATKKQTQSQAIASDEGNPNIYSLSQVSEHKNEVSCWTVVNGKVYDLTSFIRRHEGGAAKIISICGIDGTAAFEGEHGGSQEPEQALSEHYIGDLVQ